VAVRDRLDPVIPSPATPPTLLAARVIGVGLVVLHKPSAAVDNAAHRQAVGGGQDPGMPTDDGEQPGEAGAALVEGGEVLVHAAARRGLRKASQPVTDRRGLVGGQRPDSQHPRRATCHRVEVFAEPGLAERILALGAGAPCYPTPGPSRRELLDILR
jgi:hypothetical protein